ncbi:VIT domain-containing protein [Prosthecobacter debontii]|nr:VIT domain-containing protein [Prosthecobacter debontii]
MPTPPRKRSVWLLIFGVFWPCLAIIVELLSRSCRSTFFDPLPTWGHLLLTFTVPLACGLAWLRSHHPEKPTSPWHRLLLGAAWVSGSIYTCCLALLSHFAALFSVFSIFFFHREPLLTILPFATLGPLLGWLALWKARRCLPPSPEQTRPLAWIGAGLALVFFVAIETPLAIFHARLTGSSESESLEQKGARAQALRAWGDEALLRELAYGRSLQIPSPGLWLLSGRAFGGNNSWQGSSIGPELARDLYFRVYGRQFSEKSPDRQNLFLPGRRDEEGWADEFQWDSDQGSDQVGARLKGLSLHSSRLDWHLDAPSGLAYGEWTIEFSNQQTRNQEARCQILLPPDAFVSRLTLWVNGEPREAAFAAKAKVKAAYQAVVQAQRDPVLVNMVGPDRVTTQCFPVPAQGIMKIRLGITAPLSEGGNLHSPLFVERNFAVSTQIKHTLWVQSSTPFDSSLPGAMVQEGATHTWRQDVPDAQITQLAFHTSTPPYPVVWTQDPYEKTKPPFVVARWQPKPARPVAKTIWVVDSSASLHPWASDLGKVISKFSEYQPMHIILPNDTGFREISVKEVTASDFSNLFVGGRDNAPALAQALISAREHADPVSVIWLHGPQPFSFTETTSLEQILERSSRVPEIHAIALEPGPNRLLEKLYRHVQLHTHGRCLDMASLEKILQTALGRKQDSQWTFSWQSSAPTAAEAHPVWDHLARLAVFQQVLTDYQSGKDTQLLAQEAAQHQMVSAVSGAVVLETQAQYDQAGLKPVDPNSTPQIPHGVPEPSKVLFLTFGAAACVWQRRRARPARSVYI